MSGFVSLVGAGPGDPDLLTVGGAVRIAEADVIVYDRLANPALLAHARAGAELIYAGKLPDRHTLSQDEINTLLVEKARAGKRVVRLKGGDPFVFGRGGEEAEALVDAGIAFEVLPGVTSAVAAPAYAGIPVTHRGVASSFAVITAHEDPAKDDTSINWAGLATGIDTLVFLMGAGRIGEITTRLIEHGRDAATPAAVIEWGTHPRQRTVVATLATIAAAAADAGVGAPAVTVIGDVVALRDRAAWFEPRPLFGRRVLVTRTRTQASDLSRALVAAGAESIELPTIEIVEQHDEREAAAAIETLRTSGYGWVIFTSANAVTIFVRLLHAAGLDARAFARAQIAAIGPGTAAGLEAEGLRADVVPESYVAEGLDATLAARIHRGQRVLLPRATGARPLIAQALSDRGAAVDELKLYTAAVPAVPHAEGLRRLREGELDIVTFASSSAVRNLIEMLGGDTTPLGATQLAAIGPITAAAITAAGLTPAVIADEHTIDGLVRALIGAAEPGSTNLGTVRSSSEGEVR